ncbi:hypothetical protein JCM3766R1_004325 [Sporobolomyces carnicolor]
MVSLRLNTSPRVPSFSGPMALAAALMLVSIFSEPFWQNFYVLEGKALNTTIKVGAWGACTRFRNNTGITGPTTFCTSTTSSFNYYYVPNATAGGINQFPTVQDDATILGQNAADADSRIFILGSSATGVYWIHVVAAILAVLCVLSLVVPPSWLGSEESRLFAFQKSGVVTILLALSACVLSFVTFIAEIAVAIPARNRLNSINGISGQLGNVQWFVLPSAIVMLPALCSVLIRSSRPHQYSDL